MLHATGIIVSWLWGVAAFVSQIIEDHFQELLPQILKPEDFLFRISRGAVDNCLVYLEDQVDSDWNYPMPLEPQEL